MQKFMCDICKLETGRYDLTELKEAYATEQVKDVCYDCYTKITDMVNRIEKATTPIKQGWVRGFITKLWND